MATLLLLICSTPATAINLAIHWTHHPYISLPRRRQVLSTAPVHWQALPASTRSHNWRRVWSPNDNHRWQTGASIYFHSIASPSNQNVPLFHRLSCKFGTRRVRRRSDPSRGPIIVVLQERCSCTTSPAERHSTTWRPGWRTLASIPTPTW